MKTVEAASAVSPKAYSAKHTQHFSQICALYGK